MVGTIDIKCQIRGKTPLICNAFTAEAQEAATSGNRIATVGDKGSPRAQASKKLYRDPNDDNIFVIPQPNIFRCIMDAGKFFKAGRSKVTTQKSSLIPGCLEMHDTYYPIVHEQPWEVDSRPVRIPATGGRILCHRPSFEDWGLDFSMTLDTTILALTMLRDIVDKAGTAIGLGDFRPDCKGPYGRFRVTLWDAPKVEAD